ncbi:MAG: EF-P lysine aminoacylase GenX [Dehalococcoidales bacterium]|nr:EF-P lysine aminoacylase GenX [Dehalococcoidales bacterium]
MMDDECQRLLPLSSNLKQRALIYKLIRSFFEKRDFLEVETPVRVPSIAPEPYIVPFDSDGWYLSTSPELHMKRVLAAGYRRLFQLSRCFRKGEQGHLHNPEFTMLEWYCAGVDYRQIIHHTEELVVLLASAFGFNTTIRYGAQDIDISLPWPRITVRDVYMRFAGWDPIATPDPLRFDIDMVEKIMPNFSKDRPTILLDYPAFAAALARLKPDEPGIVERSEIFIGGLELANIYSELVDADEQKKRFQEAIEQIQCERGKQIAMPEKFLRAVPFITECGGAALGVDRLVMLLCNADSIDKVIPFTADTA